MPVGLGSRPTFSWSHPRRMVQLLGRREETTDVPDRQNTDLIDHIRTGFQSLVPEGVFVVVAPVGPDYVLMGSETAAMARAAKPRQLEFAAGRWCARQALVLAGGPPDAIAVGRLREPLWPPNFSGSVTHDNRLAAAAAYRLAPGELPSVGIDLIDTTDVGSFSSIASRVLSADDRAALGAQEPDGLEVAKIFAAKEAAVKILSLRAGRFIEFSEISLRPAPSGSGYLMTHAACPTPLHSRHVIFDGVLVAVATARPEAP